MKLKRILLLVTAFCCVGHYASAQRVTLDEKETRLEQILDEISGQTGFSFYYSQPTVDPDSLCTVSAKNEKLDDVLDAMFSGTSISYDIRDGKVYLIARTGNKDRYVGGDYSQSGAR